MTLLRTMNDAASMDDVPLSLGLEMVERAFQPALDAYAAGQLTDEQLYDKTEWATRWVWPWEHYLPMFRFARDRGIPLVALNADSETLRRVPVAGLGALSGPELKALVPDPYGFAAITKEPFFGRYA